MNDGIDTFELEAQQRRNRLIDLCKRLNVSLLKQPAVLELLEGVSESQAYYRLLDLKMQKPSWFGK